MTKTKQRTKLKQKRSTSRKVASNPLRMDPSRTAGLRRAYSAELTRRFARLKAAVRKLVLDEDVFGLTANCNPNQIRGADGRCGPGSPGHGFDRDDMPQIKGEDLQEFFQFAKKQGVPVMLAKKRANELKPTQGEFRQERVDAIPDAKLDDPILVSDDGHVLDGTHRWIKHWQRDPGADVPVLEIGRGVHEALDLMRRFPKAKFTANTTWEHHTNQDKVKAFAQWLEQQVKSIADRKLVAKYAGAAFAKGAGRSFDEINKSPMLDQRQRNMVAGARRQFLSQVVVNAAPKPKPAPVPAITIKFGGGASKQALEALADRSLNDLEGVTDAMQTKMLRTLHDGMARGDSPRDMVKGLMDDADISSTRATVIARTEVVRAHAEGQLAGMRELGVEQVGVQVEWSTTQDDRVCPQCESMEGLVFDLDDATGQIPLHPQCRCAWTPALPDDALPPTDGDDDGTQNSLEMFDRFLLNAFCPTGPGGGINPHCGAHGLASTPHGVPVGHALVKVHRGVAHTVTATATGFSVTSASGTTHHSSLSAAAQHVQGHGGAVNGWRFFGATNPRLAGAAPAAPTPPPASTPAPTSAPAPPPVAPPAVNPHGLTVGTKFTKSYNGQNHTLEVTDKGYKVTDQSGTTTHYTSLSAAAQGVKGNSGSVNGWAFFKVPKPASSNTPATPTPVATPHAPKSTVAETTYETGKPQPGTLNGVDFSPAPPKFWEKTKDVDIKEPPPLSKIDRVGVMIKEPDGRIWIVEPTNHFGDRKHTIPGGGVEKGLTNQQNALKEVWEETGLQVRITGHLGDFQDSNNKNNGRLYVGERIGGAPWDAKIEDGSHGVTIKYQSGRGSHDPSKNGQFAAESQSVKLVTPERAAQLLHRTDDLAQLATVAPIPLKVKQSGEMMKKLVNGIQPAAQKFLNDEKKKLSAAGVSSYSQRPGNQELYVVQELRGFNAKPKQVSKMEMDALLKQGGHIEMLRGLSDAAGKTSKELADDFRNGQHYPGHGIFGSGTYADSNKGYGNVATSGQYGNAVIRMALPKTAKIIKASELEKAVPNAPDKFKAYQNNGGKESRECWMGVQAALAGYDAIHADKAKSSHKNYGDDFYIILNRGVLVVQKEGAKGHVIK